MVGQSSGGGGFFGFPPAVSFAIGVVPRSCSFGMWYRHGFVVSKFVLFCVSVILNTSFIYDNNARLLFLGWSVLSKEDAMGQIIPIVNLQ